MKVLFLTSNVAKVALANHRLHKYGIEVIQKTVDFNESRSMEVEDVAKDKAKQVMNVVDENFIIEDSAFYIPALNGFPGTQIKLAFDVLGEERITHLVKSESNKRAFSKSALIFGDPKNGKIQLFTGIYEGKIAPKPKGDNLRGWKIVRVFIPQGWNKTIAQFSDSEWQKFLKEFQQNDHFEKLGQWLSGKKSSN